MHDPKHYLRASGLKATPARIAVLQALYASTDPLRIEDIHERMNVAADPATVYRTVNALATAGIVRHVHFGEHSAYFEPADRPHHHHLVCTACGTVADIDYCPAQLEHKALAQAPQFSRIEQHSLELFGTCKQCS